MKRRLYVCLFGGANYTLHAEAEPFDSLADAAREWEGRKFSSYYPCWGEPTYLNNDGRFTAAFAWWIDPDTEHPDSWLERDGRTLWDSTDVYPDRQLTVGPRGGLRWERC